MLRNVWQIPLYLRVLWFQVYDVPSQKVLMMQPSQRSTWEPFVLVWIYLQWISYAKYLSLLCQVKILLYLKFDIKRKSTLFGFCVLRTNTNIFLRPIITMSCGLQVHLVVMLTKKHTGTQTNVLEESLCELLKVKTLFSFSRITCLRQSSNKLLPWSHIWIVLFP